MNIEFQQELVKKYPSLLRDMWGNPSETCLSFGVETNGDGWNDIIDTALAFLDSYNQKHNLDIRIVQIKEKFGALRIYESHGDDHVDNLTYWAEVISRNTCESCGKYGKLYTTGWQRTLCKDHAKEYGYVIE